MKIHQENLEHALSIAIAAQTDKEHQQFGPDFESALVTGWKQVFEASQRGETVEVEKKS